MDPFCSFESICCLLSTGGVLLTTMALKSLLSGGGTSGSGDKEHSVILAYWLQCPLPPFCIPHSEPHLLFMSSLACAISSRILWLLRTPSSTLKHVQNSLPANTVVLPGRNLVLSCPQHTLLEGTSFPSSHVPIRGDGSSILLLTVNILSRPLSCQV